MFSTVTVLDSYRSSKLVITDAVENINMGEFDKGKSSLEELKNKIEVPKGNLLYKFEQQLNELFVFRTYIQFLITYADYWKALTEEKFSHSWNSLQDTINQFRIVKKFSEDNEESKHLVFFEKQLISLEKLYPYNIFFSIGAVVDYYECSICGLDIDSDDCPHFKGNLYGGVMAVAIAKNIRELNHISMVKHPADKRCVVKYEEDGEQFKLVRYLSSLVREKRLKPFDFGELRFSNKIIPNPDYVKLGRNEKCFCGSGLKFKHCCIDKKSVKGGHVDIVSNPISVQTILA
jgi:hypothetical protein